MKYIDFYRKSAIIAPISSDVQVQVLLSAPDIRYRLSVPDFFEKTPLIAAFYQKS